MYGTAWDSRKVIERLAIAFRRLPATPVYSPTAERIEAAFFERPVDGAALIVATGFYLGYRSARRTELLEYARALGRRQVAQLCREKGWSRSTLYRHVRPAAEAVAQGLNRDRRPLDAVA